MKVGMVNIARKRCQSFHSTSGDKAQDIVFSTMWFTVKTCAKVTRTIQNGAILNQA